MVSNTYCVVFLFCFSSSYVLYVASFLDCPFLIAPLVFSHVYLIPPHFIEVAVPSQESERSCIYMLVVSLWLCFYDFLIGLWTVSGSVVFVCFKFITVITTSVPFSSIEQKILETKITFMNTLY